MDTADGDAAGVVRAADVVVAVVSAERYADAAVWRVLRGVEGRGVPVAVVLGRVGGSVVGEVEGAFADLLRVNGLAAAPLFVVEEVEEVGGYGDGGLGRAGGPAGGAGVGRGVLPGEVVAGLWGWLREAGADTAGRVRIGRLGVAGRLDHVQRLVGEVAGAWEGQRLALEVLHQGLERVHTAERVRFRGLVDGGELFGGEVRIRWQEVLGSGRISALFGAGAESKKAGKAADWSERFHNQAGHGAGTAPLRAALVETVARAYRAALERAARKTADQWELTPGAPKPRSPDEAARRALDPARAAAAWLDSLPGAIRDQARSRRTTRTIGPTGAGIRSAALVLGVAALAGGVEGAAGAAGAGEGEPRGAEGSKLHRADSAAGAALGLLRAMFGAEDAERLLVTAVAGLKDGNARLLDRAADVHREQLAAYALDPGQARALDDARTALARARSEKD
ncbi:MAG: hypothetical protein JF587_12670 [Catenulisporales bacterium]|nr:hypothetical protein [Catenulisporales bacterium]